VVTGAERYQNKIMENIIFSWNWNLINLKLIISKSKQILQKDFTKFIFLPRKSNGGWRQSLR
jgi:hypothetical protein